MPVITRSETLRLEEQLSKDQQFKQIIFEARLSSLTELYSRHYGGWCCGRPENPSLPAGKFLTAEDMLGSLKAQSRCCIRLRWPFRRYCLSPNGFLATKWYFRDCFYYRNSKEILFAGMTMTLAEHMVLDRRLRFTVTEQKGERQRRRRSINRELCRIWGNVYEDWKLMCRVYTHLAG